MLIVRVCAFVDGAVSSAMRCGVRRLLAFGPMAEAIVPAARHAITREMEEFMEVPRSLCAASAFDKSTGFLRANSLGVIRQPTQN